MMRGALSRPPSSTSSAAVLPQAQLRRRHAPVEDQHVAGRNEVGIADLLLIHAPDLGPAPRVFEEFRGDAPECIAPLYDVAVRGVVLQRQLALREGQRSRARKDERAQSCDRLLHVRLAFVWI